MPDELYRAISILREEGLEMQAMGGCIKRDGGEPETKRNIGWQFSLRYSFDLDTMG